MAEAVVGIRADRPRVIIVGAGPAGSRAAAILVEAGLRPTLVEESSTNGGQIYRRQPKNFRRGYAELYGSEAAKALEVHNTFEDFRQRIDYRPDTIAWNVYSGRLYVASCGRSTAMPFDALILATGAVDRVMPVPGWTLPGVFSLGGAQIALKAQACAIGRRVAFVGTGPLLYLVASQYAAAGAEVAGVFDTSPATRRIAALPALAARPDNLLKGISLLRTLRRKAIPVHAGVTPVSIQGNSEAGVSSVTVRNTTRTVTVDCDAVGLGYHLRPETQLADLARCEFHFDKLTRQWLPALDEDGRSSVNGVYLAGDGARVLGADGAEIAGKLAAYAVLTDSGRPVPKKEVDQLRKARRKMIRFGRGLALAFPWPAHLAASLPDDALVCRCEAITAGEIRFAASELGALEVNRAKAFSRVGMGRCQGRYCGHAAAEVLADTLHLPIESVGRLRGQAPVKPLSMTTRKADS